VIFVVTGTTSKITVCTFVFLPFAITALKAGQPTVEKKKSMTQLGHAKEKRILWL
jgi:hypothetical protein